jgi:hypothetical protein
LGHRSTHMGDSLEQADQGNPSEECEDVRQAIAELKIKPSGECDCVNYLGYDACVGPQLQHSAVVRALLNIGPIWMKNPELNPLTLAAAVSDLQTQWMTMNVDKAHIFAWTYAVLLRHCPDIFKGDVYLAFNTWGIIDTGIPFPSMATLFDSTTREFGSPLSSVYGDKCDKAREEFFKSFVAACPRLVLQPPDRVKDGDAWVQCLNLNDSKVTHLKMNDFMGVIRKTVCNKYPQMKDRWMEFKVDLNANWSNGSEKEIGTCMMPKNVISMVFELMFKKETMVKMQHTQAMQWINRSTVAMHAGCDGVVTLVVDLLTFLIHSASEQLRYVAKDLALTTDRKLWLFDEKGAEIPFEEAKPTTGPKMTKRPLPSSLK